MITAKISAGSSSIVQDIINMCQSIHSPIGGWQGFFYKSTTGNKPWCVWAARMDEDAHELQYVSSSGLDAPDDSYEYITVACPTTTGFDLSFTQVNAMPSVLQTGKGGGAGSGTGGSAGTVYIRVSAKTTMADFNSILASLTPGTAHTLSRYYFKSAGGSQSWAVYAIATTFNYANPVASIFLTMGGMAVPPAESENLAISAPSASDLSTYAFTQISTPINFTAR